MKIIEGKSPAERNKIIAALVLGALALIAVGYNLIGFIPGKKSSTAVKQSQGAGQPGAPSKDKPEQLPSTDATTFEYESTEINYAPGLFSAPEALRNIFAFGESPLPQPTQVIEPTGPGITLPSPTPPPPITVSSVTPQSVYAGSKSFRLEVSGDRFTPETKIYFNGGEMPTTFVTERRIWTEVPANFITAEGVRVIKVRTPDGMLYSNDVTINVMAPPRPTFSYLGPLIRKRSNNDTAYIQEQGSQTAIGRRLNDIIGGRFRLVSISPARVIVEDVNLGFRHTVNISTAAMPSGGSTQPSGFSPDPTMIPYNNPNMQVPPGIPVPRYDAPKPNQPPNPNQTDQDDSDGDDGGGR